MGFATCGSMFVYYQQAMDDEVNYCIITVLNKLKGVD